MNRYLISLEGKSWEWCKDNFKLITLEDFINQGGFKRDDIMLWPTFTSVENRNILPEFPTTGKSDYNLFTNFEPKDITIKSNANYDYDAFNIGFVPNITFNTPTGPKEINYNWKMALKVGCFILKRSEFSLLNWINVNPLEGK